MALFKRRKKSREDTDALASSSVSAPAQINDLDLVIDETYGAPTPMPVPEKTQAVKLQSSFDQVKFVGGENLDFAAPKFSASIPSQVKNIDVSKPDASDINNHETALEPHTDISTLRDDMVRITTEIFSDIEQGDTLYRRAQKRVEGLMSFVEKAEMDYTAINRLEPENRRLKAKITDLKAEIDVQSDLIETSQTTITNYERQLSETKLGLDEARRRLSATTGSIKRRDQDLRKAATATEQLKTKLERQAITSNVESNENNVLRNKLKEVSGILIRLNQEKLMQAKMIESLRADYDDLRSSKGVAQKTQTHYKAALQTAKKRNVELLSQLESLQDDIHAFKTQYEINLANRDQRINKLEAETETLERQVSVKEEAIAESTKNVTDMQSGKDTQALNAARLEKVISQQTQKIDTMRRNLAEREKENLNLRNRVEQAANPMSQDDLTRLQHIITNQKQDIAELRDKLADSQSEIKDRDERYSAVSEALQESRAKLAAQIPSLSPDITPASSSETNESTMADAFLADAFEITTENENSEFDGLSEENIDSMMLDYALGLRKSISG